jgi:diguanylate cyclase (GGDEF)-like protein/PAS domain S-box-containing protein
MRDTLLQLARDAAFAARDLTRFTALVTERVTEALDVQRASVWFLDEQRQLLRCADRYDRSTAMHDSGTALEVARYPEYFRALELDRALAAHDARSDARTAQLFESYTAPAGITSMLDATVRRAGAAIGVVCAEHVGDARVWSSHEESFAASVADFMSIALEMEERRRAEEALRRNEERYRGFISLSAEGIWRIDIDPPVPIGLPVMDQVRRIACEGRYAECNAAYAEMHGLSGPGDIIGKTTDDLVPEDIYSPLIEHTVRSGYTVHELEIVRSSEGRQRWFSLNVLGMVEDDHLVRFWGVQREITERIEQMSTLEHQATHDGLTGLWNREWLYRRLGDTVSRDGRMIALLLLDIDNLREINDSIGHEAGDVLLSSVSNRLRALASRHECDVARFGGDEFAIITSASRGPAACAALASVILDAVREPHEVSGIAVELGASIGIALAPHDANDAQTLIRRAEVAMYSAKADLRKFSFYDSERDPHSPSRLALVGGLGAAIRRDELVVHFQPKIDLQKKCVNGYEALVRWEHPSRGLVPPGEFMPWAEKSDLIRPLTFYILERTLAQLRAWRDAGLETTVAVNLSTRNLLDEEAPERIAELLRKSGIPPSMLIFEITESSMMHDPARALQSLREIDALGVRLSIDDFGTGYSSLSYLKRLPIDELKIDLSFVTHMLDSAEDRTIVQSTIGLGHNLGLSVTAEGVEDARTYEALRAMGCDAAQGYFFSRPMPAGDVAAWHATAEWK